MSPVLAVTPIRAATTFSNDYPDGDAADCSGQYGVDSWCKNGSWLSSRRYGYKNCTDGAAYWVQKYTGVTLPTNLGDANTWDDNIPTAFTKYDGNTNSIEPGDIAQSDDGTFGHVGFVISVTKDSSGRVTSFVAAELNHTDKTGDYNTYTYSTRNASGKFARLSLDVKEQMRYT